MFLFNLIKFLIFEWAIPYLTFLRYDVPFILSFLKAKKSYRFAVHFSGLVCWNVFVVFGVLTVSGPLFVKVLIFPKIIFILTKLYLFGLIWF